MIDVDLTGFEGENLVDFRKNERIFIMLTLPKGMMNVLQDPIFDNCIGC